MKEETKSVISITLHIIVLFIAFMTLFVVGGGLMEYTRCSQFEDEGYQIRMVQSYIFIFQCQLKTSSGKWVSSDGYKLEKNLEDLRRNK